GQNRRFDARVQWLRKWIGDTSNPFGELQSFDLFAFQDIRSWIAIKPNPEADFWILDKERAGGGVVMSLLIHLLDLVRALSGLDFVEATARARFDPPFKNGAESACSGLLTLSNGAAGTFHANYLAPRHPRAGEGLTLFGTEGMARHAGRWEYATAAGKGPSPWGKPDEGLAAVPVDAATPFHSFTTQLLSFAEAVKGGTRPLNHLEDNFNTLAVVEAIYSSIDASGQPVAVARP
ncbi:MAG: Gfo/Idh/MocA family protein, partial [Opitutales bacterium]